MDSSDFDYVYSDGTIQKTHRYNIPEGKWHFAELGDKLYDMWMHAVTYRVAIFDGLDYHQTEGISYTDQEWIYLPMSKVTSVCVFPHVVYKYLVGREGQTVNPKVFAQNISQEIRSWKTQLEEWEASAQNGRGEAEAYMWYRLKSRAVNVYKWMILQYKEGFDHRMLLKLDKYIKEHNPSLYESMDSAVIRKGLKFRYIHYWRMWHCRPLIWICAKTESVLKRKLLGI